MKREARLLIIFISIIILSGVVSAANCDVRLRTSCATSPFNKIVMGISAATNSHGEVSTTGSYQYVLCCDFGTGNTACAIDNSNKILGLSAATNAHANIPTGSYTNPVCYENLLCVSVASSCPSDNPIPILSLSATTNAHIANYSGTGSYPTKICCKDNSHIFGLDCDLTNAYWQYSTNVVEGTTVEMILEGTECSSGNTGADVKFDVYKKNGLLPGTLVETIDNENFDRGTWVTSLSDPSANSEDYYFIATAILSADVFDSRQGTSNDYLTVISQSKDFCLTRSRCGDFTVQSDCESFDTICSGRNIAEEDDNCATTTPPSDCTCKWNTGTSKCEFAFDYLPQPITCSNGFTLCNTHPGETDGFDYCHPGNTCPEGQDTLIDGDNKCDAGADNNGEGCYTSDCKNGDQDSCASGTTCQNGMCTGAAPTPEPVTGCDDGFTLCHDSDLNMDYCYPDTSCPANEKPVEDTDTTCEIGDGCSSSDCISGGVAKTDSCLSGSYCGTGGNAGTCFSPTATQGTCVFHETTTDDCSDGTLEYSWTTEWLPSRTGEPKPADCVSGSRVIPCAAQVQLSFFGIYQILGTITAVTIIYLVAALIRKNSKKKKNKK